jgi:four helix bundle protein
LQLLLIMKESLIAQKSYDFAVDIVNLYKTVLKREKEFTMSKQLLRCGTSIGANIAEASGSISKREFIAKMQISYKEAQETKFWIRLLTDTGYLSEHEKTELLFKNEELIKILFSILRSSKE